MYQMSFDLEVSALGLNLLEVRRRSGLTKYRSVEGSWNRPSSRFIGGRRFESSRTWTSEDLKREECKTPEL
jgi:hypothetical protein